MLTFDDSTGRLKLEAGEFSAENGRISVETDRAVAWLDDSDITPFTVTVDVEDGSILCLAIRNTGPRDLILKTVRVLFSPDSFKKPREAAEHRQLLYSRESGDGPTGVKPVHVPTAWAAVSPTSHLVTVYHDDRSRQALLIGALPPWGGSFTSVNTVHQRRHAQGAFGFEVVFDFRQSLQPGQTASASRVCFATGESGEELLEQYGRLLGRRLDFTTKAPAVGWNSWDYYRGAVERRHMDENREACRRLFGDAVKYLVIDGGWECAWGAWEANWKFPQGVADFCSDTKRHGFIPGIWTAPLMCAAFAPLRLAHPDWFARDAKGDAYTVRMVYGQMAIMDITVPAVQEHLRRVYRRLRAEGLEYFKCDFMALALNADRFSDSSVGRGQLLRTAFALIRESIGPDAYLLACGVPFESGLGIADATRVTQDIHIYWNHIRNSVRTLAAGTWMRHAVGIDPDYLVVRNEQTNDGSIPDPFGRETPEDLGPGWMTGRVMTLEETKVWALTVCLIGGEVFLSDAVNMLNAAGIQILQTCLDAKLPPARTVNLFTPGQEETPMLVSQGKDQTVVGLFNLTELPCTLKIDESIVPSRSTAVDFWTGQPIEFDPTQSMTIPPRSSVGLRFRT